MSPRRREILVFLPSRLDTCPSGDVFLESDRDIAESGSHNTNIVRHETRVKPVGGKAFPSSLTLEATGKVG
jgi:hypothetical protein